MESEAPQEIYFCRQHNAVAFEVSRNGKSTGTFCNEDGEYLTRRDIYLGVAWIFSWEDLGYEDDPFDKT